MYANGLNWRRDPADLLAALPVDRTVQVHLAGGHWRGDVYVDSHSAPVPDPVWELLDQVLRTVRPSAVTLERDDPGAPLREVRADVDRAAGMVAASDSVGPAAPVPAGDLRPAPGPDLAGLPRAPVPAELARKTRTDLRSVFRASWPSVEDLVESGLPVLADLSAGEITPIGRAERAVPWLAGRGADGDRLRLDVEVARHQLLGRPGERAVVDIGARRVQLETTDRFGVRVRVLSRPTPTAGDRMDPVATDETGEGGERHG